MNTIIINGAALIDQHVSQDGDTLIARCVKNTSEKKDNKWGEKANYFSILLSGDLRTRFEKMNPKPGSSLWVIGSYYTDTHTSEDGKVYLNIAVIPYNIGYSSGSVGTTGLFDICQTNIGLINEPTVVSQNFAYVDGLYDIGYGENKRVEKLRLCINGEVPAFIAKGKRIDVIGRLDITLNLGKDGKTYINKTVYVKEANKTPFTPKKSENNAAPAAAPAPTTASAAVPAQQTQVATAPVNTEQPIDLADFDEISTGGAPAFF